MIREEWRITDIRISSRSNADVYYGDKTVRIPGEVMVRYFLADPYDMFWLEKEDRDTRPWDLPEENGRISCLKKRGPLLWKLSMNSFATEKNRSSF